MFRLLAKALGERASKDTKNDARELEDEEYIKLKGRKHAS